MRVLFFDQIGFSDMDLIWGLLECGHDVVCAEFRVPDAEYTDADLTRVTEEIRREEAEGKFDLIVTKDFSAVVAEACHGISCRYLSWVHDSPQRALYLKEALYDSNRIFVFDKKQYGRMKERGIGRVYHQPLAANVRRVSMPEIANADPSRFAAEISFIGNLYENDARNRFFDALSAAARNECMTILDGKTGHWDDTHSIYQPISKETLEEMRACYDGEDPGSYDFSFAFLMQVLVLAQEAAMRERVEALRMLSDTFPVTLYTSHPEEAAKLLPAVKVQGPVSHEEEMPLVYRASKINLNLTSPSIETGIPLRVFEIMSVGGFVLTNYQAEIPELFKTGQEIVTFSDYDELKEKAAYYLSHDRERERIAAGGFKKVSEKYTCPMAVRRMLSKIG